MDVRDSEEEAAFRAEARQWLEAHAPERGGPDDWSRRFWDPGADWTELVDRCRQWQRELFDAGWAGVSYPQAFGGRGGTSMEELIFNQEAARRGVMMGPFAVALTMVGPAILEFGTPAQRDRFVPAMLRGDEIWAQLFSEPGSGSDLASLTTRAVRDGDEFVVDGQKVWTSHADHADWAILLARTGTPEDRHRGISYLLVDMRTPGIEVRPLLQMTGQRHFSEVFLTGVRVPVVNVLGGPDHIGAGWRAAMHTLSNERAMIGAASNEDDLRGLAELARLHGVIDHPSVRQGMARAHERAGILRFLGYRLQTAISQGRPPGPETSVLKLFYSDHLKAVTQLALEIQGAAGMLAPAAGSGVAAGPEGWPGWFHLRFLYAPSLSIAGGTSEVQRGIIGDRVLHLPAEPKGSR